MNNKTEESAFPVTEYFENGNGDNVPYCEKPGLTKREWYAGMALQGICGDGIPGAHHTPEQTARDAWAYADAMVSCNRSTPGGT